MAQSKKILDNSLFFPTAMWLFSRILIAFVMLLIAPLLPVLENGNAATFSLDVFYAWDSGWYDSIATSGYEYISDGKQHSVAFFPLFPLLIRILMNLGLSFKVAGLLINNLAFLAALIILYLWVEEYSGKTTARWTIAAFAWCPYSLFGTVIYTEGLFLLLTTAALITFSKQQYISAGFWGILSTATRVPGICLIPACLFMCWKEGRSLKAYITSLSMGIGLLLYSFYCSLTFGDALAFADAQKGWRDSAGFAWKGWFNMLTEIVIGPINAKSGYLKDPWYPLIFAICISIVYLLWRFRKKLNSTVFCYGIFLLLLVLWLLAGYSFFKILFIYGGLYLLWWVRNKVPLIVLIYGFFSYILILNTGLTASVERYAYGIISLSFAFGVLFSYYPVFGRLLLGFYTYLLVSLAIRFSQNIWAA